MSRHGRAARTPRAVLLMGPTASGKSRLAMALARRLPVEIVSVDSAQVYRGMDVGTAKPSAADRREVRHHLLDIVLPTQAYSAARFREDAGRLVGEIASRARVPLLVGGTMLYFRSLVQGLSELPQANGEIRAEIEREALERGWPALHADLVRVDPEAARRLAPADSQRIQRALEVYRVTGRTLSALLAERRPLAAQFECVPVALLPPDRAVLHRRIESRFDAMLEAGLVEELRALRRELPLEAGMPSMRCVGYRQAFLHLEGRLDRVQLREQGIFATRQLAKRQMTWLRRWPGAATLDCFDPGLVDRVAETVAGALGA